MEFFCYHRDRVGSVELREELLEEHWSYMDRYAAEMVARGPTFASDGDTPTGSVHIVDLADPAAARAFAFDEPNYQAGVYGPGVLGHPVGCAAVAAQGPAVLSAAGLSVDELAEDIGVTGVTSGRRAAASSTPVALRTIESRWYWRSALNVSRSSLSRRGGF